MSQFKPNQLLATAPHKVTVTLFFREDGRKQSVETDCFYRGVSLDTITQITDVGDKQGQERLDALKQQLAQMVVSIPAFGVGPFEEGFEQQPDVAFFGALEDANIDAISNAIAEDRDPNMKPSNS